MKRNSFITYLFGSACMLGACTTTVVDEPDIQDTAINFSTPNARAVIEGKLPAGSSFKIWGYHTLTEGQGISEVFADFEGEKVTELNGQWTYTGGTRYWIPRYTYNFYALYPFYPTESQNEEETIASCDADGNLTVTNFDCSKTGKEAIDLMTAFPEPIPFSEGQMAQPVGLTFKHKLSRVNFNIESTSSVVTVNSLKVYGVNYKGIFTRTVQPTESESWSDLTSCTSQDTPYKISAPFTLDTKEGFKKNPFGDLLLIPHKDTQLQAATLYIAYRYPGDQQDRTSTILLNTKQKEWLAGGNYNYKLTFSGGNLSLTVKVAEWTEDSGSVSWGDEVK